MIQSEPGNLERFEQRGVQYVSMWVPLNDLVIWYTLILPPFTTDPLIFPLTLHICHIFHDL